MWTTSYIGSNSGYQHFINLKSHLGSVASFVQNKRLTYKLVDRLDLVLLTLCTIKFLDFFCLSHFYIKILMSGLLLAVFNVYVFNKWKIHE